MIKPSSILIFGSLLIVLQSNKHSTGIDLTKRNYISCSPDYLDKFDTTLNGKFIVPLPGWGAYGYSISTDNDSAQFYFNQGLNMYYGYHPKEAIASFKEAARFDPACPMAYWGQVLALGPNYNSAYTYSMPKEVPGIIQLMNRTLGHESAKEKKLIEAMNSRYSSDGSDAQRVTLNRSYSQAMRKLIDLYPNDMDLKAFYVDAMMLIHPWDFWTNIGTAKEWTPELIKLCEVILKANPNHPAALHYYIHLTEASRHPEIALGNAELLKRLFPGVAHMVHMASHEYERNGLFAEGVEVNDKADADLVRYESIAKNVSLNNHAPHYFAVQAYCAFSAGMYQDGMRTALRCRNSVSQTHENTYNQYLYMMPILTLVRLGKWEEILQDRIEPDAQWLYAGLLYDFAKGLAFVYTGHLDSASNRLTLLKSKANDPTLTVRRIPFNTALQGAGIAKEILNAVILFAQKKYAEAINSFTIAEQIEDSLIYSEPKDWPIPSRQFLGAYLQIMGKPDIAEKVYLEDLMWNPNNGWSLLGLYQALNAQHKITQLDEYRSKYLKSFLQAERIPPTSIFMNDFFTIPNNTSRKANGDVQK